MAGLACQMENPAFRLCTVFTMTKSSPETPSTNMNSPCWRNTRCMYTHWWQPCNFLSNFFILYVYYFPCFVSLVEGMHSRSWCRGCILQQFPAREASSSYYGVFSLHTISDSTVSRFLSCTTALPNIYVFMSALAAAGPRLLSLNLIRR